jgi:hypothetical protein
MIAVRMMQPSVHEVIDVVAMRNSLVSAARPMGVTGAPGLRRALHRIGGVDRDDMLVDMITVHVVQVAVVEVVDMAIVANRRMPAVWTVLVAMVGMVLLGAGGHVFPFLACIRFKRSCGHFRSAACSTALCTSCRT